MAIANQTTTVRDRGPTSEIRTQQRKVPAASFVLGLLTIVAMSITIWMVFFYTPIDALQGVTQRILYFHVPTAWAGMLSFIIMAALGIIYLIRPDERLDWLSRAAAIDVPIIYLSVDWWRGQHPTQQITPTNSGALPPLALITLAVGLIAFSLLYAFMMVQAYQLQRLQTLAQRLRAIVE
jgi:ABC-type transport system involved in cytochrome c biogenesis permease subunit